MDGSTNDPEALKQAVKEALREHAREICAKVGHDWQTFNWIGIGTTQTCKRCTLRTGLKYVDAEGVRHFYDGSTLPPVPPPDLSFLREPQAAPKRRTILDIAAERLRRREPSD